MFSAVGGGVVWAEKRTIVAIPSSARRMQFSLFGQMAAGSYVGERGKLAATLRCIDRTSRQLDRPRTPVPHPLLGESRHRRRGAPSPALRQARVDAAGAAAP